MNNNYYLLSNHQILYKIIMKFLLYQNELILILLNIYKLIHLIIHNYYNIYFNVYMDYKFYILIMLYIVILNLVIFYYNLIYLIIFKSNIVILDYHNIKINKYIKLKVLLNIFFLLFYVRFHKNKLYIMKFLINGHQVYHYLKF